MTLCIHCLEESTAKIVAEVFRRTQAVDCTTPSSAYTLAFETCLMNDASSPSNNRPSLRVRHWANFFIAGINIGGTSDFNMFMASLESHCGCPGDASAMACTGPCLPRLAVFGRSFCVHGKLWTALGRI